MVSDIAETLAHKQIDILMESSYPTNAMRDFHSHFFHRTIILGVLDEFAYIWKNVAITLLFVTVFKNTDGSVWLYVDILYYIMVERNIDSRNIFTSIYLLNQEVCLVL